MVSWATTTAEENRKCSIIISGARSTRVELQSDSIPTPSLRNITCEPFKPPSPYDYDELHFLLKQLAENNTKPSVDRLTYDSESPAGKKDAIMIRRHQTCDFREHATSAPAELGGEIHNVSRNRARAQVLLQARKLHVYGSGTFGAFWRNTAGVGGAIAFLPLISRRRGEYESRS